jgi:hypothetical protein
MALGSTQPLTEMSTRNFRGGGGVKVWQARKADNLTATSEPSLENVGVSTSYSPMRLHGLLQEYFTFT